MGRPKSVVTRCVERYFSDAVDDGDGVHYKCTVEGCLAKVKCLAGRGAPGRTHHLRVHHPQLLDGIFEENPKAKRQRKEAAAADAKEGEEKKHEETEKEKDRSREADFFARQLLPFSVADDEYFNGVVTRKTVVPAIVQRQKGVLKKFFDENKGRRCTISIDSGTNAGIRTINICVCFGASVLVASRRIETHTTENLCEAVEDVLAPPFGLAVSAFVGDNAANIKATISSLAEKKRCVWFCCACHSIHNLVKKIAHQWKVVDDARKLCDKLREGGSNVPIELDSRWAATFDAISFVVDNCHSLVFDGKAEHTEIVNAKEALVLLKPFYTATLDCQKESSTIFDAVAALGSCLSDAVSKDAVFLDTFERNVYCPAIVAACALSPTWAPESAIKPIQAMVTQVLVGLVDLTSSEVEHEKVAHDRATSTQISLLLSGALQKMWRLSEVRRSDIWLKGETPKLEELFRQLLSCCASSASVERSFSFHARAQTKSRMSVGEANIAAQISLHSLLKTPTGVSFADAFPNEIQVERVLMSCVQCWCVERCHQLKPGDSIVAWYETNKRLTPYRGRLVEEAAHRNWKVRWAGDPGSHQRFNPAVDPWVFHSEA